MTANHRLSRALMTMAFLAALAPLAARGQAAQLPTPGSQLPQPQPLLRSAAPAPATRPAAIPGRLFIRAVQGTAGAPAAAKDTVTVYFQGGQKINPVPMRLDDAGTAELTGIPLARGSQLVPIIIVEHAGIRYQVVGDPMDPARPDQRIDVTVYEVTERLPEWCIPVRQVMLARAPEGIRVTETLAVENSTDRAWVGSPDAAGQRPTVAMALPQGARDLQFAGGFSPELTRFDGSMLRHSAPLSPGITQYQVSYMLPSVGSQLVIPITAPATIHDLKVLIADDGSPVSVSGLEAQGTTEPQNGEKARQFGAKELKPGQAVSITVATAPPAVAAADSEPSVLPKVIAGATLVGLLVVASVVMFLRSTKPAAADACCGKCDQDH